MPKLLLTTSSVQRVTASFPRPKGSHVLERHVPSVQLGSLAFLMNLIQADTASNSYKGSTVFTIIQMGIVREFSPSHGIAAGPTPSVITFTEFGLRIENRNMKAILRPPSLRTPLPLAAPTHPEAQRPCVQTQDTGPGGGGVTRTLELWYW